MCWNNGTHPLVIRIFFISSSCQTDGPKEVQWVRHVVNKKNKYHIYRPLVLKYETKTATGNSNVDQFLFWSINRKNCWNQPPELLSSIYVLIVDNKLLETSPLVPLFRLLDLKLRRLVGRRFIRFESDSWLLLLELVAEHILVLYSIN